RFGSPPATGCQSFSTKVHIAANFLSARNESRRVKIRARRTATAGFVSSTSGSLLHGINDGPVVVALVAHELQKLWQCHVVLAQKRTVASATIHQVRVQL